MDKDEITLSVILLVIFCCFILIFFIDWYNLHKFKKCYDINFTENYCTKYLDY